LFVTLLDCVDGKLIALRISCLQHRMQPDRLVLITPMVGITPLARIAGFAALPALLPPFAKATWLSVMPEFNPFKYNSFPVNGARQSVRVADALQEQIARYSREGKLI
jgi:alpha-beta hydrolase superfamily lysophospholipase